MKIENQNKEKILVHMSKEIEFVFNAAEAEIILALVGIRNATLGQSAVAVEMAGYVTNEEIETIKHRLLPVMSIMRARLIKQFGSETGIHAHCLATEIRAQLKRIKAEGN